MRELIIVSLKKSVITIIIGGIILLCMVSCSAPQKSIKQAPMKHVAVPYWG